MTLGVVDQAAGARYFFCCITPEGLPVVLEGEHIPHWLLWRVGVFRLPLLVSEESATVVTYYLAHAEGTRSFDTTAATAQIIHHFDAFPVLFGNMLLYLVNLQQQTNGVND